MTETERQDDTGSSTRSSDGKADERKNLNSIAQVSRNREWEEQERRIREQKLGLHPLQVLLRLTKEQPAFGCFQKDLLSSLSFIYIVEDMLISLNKVILVTQ